LPLLSPDFHLFGRVGCFAGLEEALRQPLRLLGGVLGMLAGVLSSAVVEQLFEFPTKLTPEVLAIGGLFAASIGILFGYYPARKASQLDPIQGLRYE
jgi:putative ABC transport system permease protein